MPTTGVIQAADGKLYGTTSFGAGNNAGAIYSKTVTGGAVTDLHSFNPATDGSGTMNDLLQATNGNFYGASFSGGTGDQGSLYELTSAGTFSAFLLDGPTTGAQPASTLMQHTNGTIFGTTSANGGFSFVGTFFSLNIGASPFVSLVSSSGKVGTQVGILGQGLIGSSVVKFGGVPATTVALTGSTFALATAPTGAHTGSVTVTTGATTLTSSKMFQVTPTVSGFTPASGHVGASVTISGTGLIQATKVTFNKKQATFTVNSDSQITATVPTGATTGKLAVTTNGGGIASSAKNFIVN